MDLGPSHKRLLQALSGAFLLILTACGSKGEATPTMGAEAVFTFAAQTFEANLNTQAALATPTNTPAPTATPLPALPTFAPLPLSTISFDAPTALPGSGAAACSDAAFVADVTIPDNTRLDPGQKFAKTWRVQNTGTCPWNPSFKLTHHDGLEMGGADVYLPLPVPVGQQVDLTVNLRAPTSPGDYYGRWQLQDDAERPFGSYLSVVIKVVSLSP
jgi:hypothetical protein